MDKENITPIYKDYSPVFEMVKKLWSKNSPVIIAIDGRCGSGKTFLAALLEKSRLLSGK